MAGYIPLFSSLISSSVWNEDSDTCKVWITLMAMSDKDGLVEGSIVGIAPIARISAEACATAIKILEAPDPNSRSPEYEGRRLLPVPGGWKLVNHKKIPRPCQITRRLLPELAATKKKRKKQRNKRNKLRGRLRQRNTREQRATQRNTYATNIKQQPKTPLPILSRHSRNQKKRSVIRKMLHTLRSILKTRLGKYGLERKYALLRLIPLRTMGERRKTAKKPP